MLFSGFFWPKKRGYLGLGLLLLVGCFGFSDWAMAASANNTLDSIVNTYKTHSAAWESTLMHYATSLFWILAGIEFSWTGIRLALKGAEFSEWLAELVNLIFFIGFFFSLVLYSSEWANDIVKSFITAGSTASGSSGGMTGITPSNIFDLGLSLGVTVMKDASLWHPADSIGLMLSALIIVICFAFIASSLALALIEAYIVIAASSLLMGFGGSRWTKDYALTTLRYVVSVGAKLFMMQLIVGLGESFMTSWTQNFELKTLPLFTIIGASIVMLAITKELPNFVQSMINGASLGNGGAITGAANMVASATGAVAGSMMGAGMAVGASAKLAQLQKNAGMLGEGQGLMGATLGNLKEAATEDVGRRLSGRAHHGNMGGRIADSLTQKAKEVALESEKPESNSPQSSS